MPTASVKKLAKKHGMSVGKAEGHWEAAKKRAAKQGHAEDFDYVTAIFKTMMGESTKESFKDFLLKD